MRNVVDVLPNKPEECLYCYKSMFGKNLCKHTKKNCELELNGKTGEYECDKLMALDDMMKETLKAYTKKMMDVKQNHKKGK